MSTFCKVFLVLAVVTPCAVQAQTGATGTLDASPGEGWSFAVTPYAWFASLRGELTTIAGLPPFKVDRSASQALEDIDSAFMCVGEVRRGRYGSFLAFIYSTYATSGRYPLDSSYSTLATDTKNYNIDVTGFYRGWTWPDAFVDAVGGVRIWNAKLTTDLGAGDQPARYASEDQTWVDPLVGAKGRYDVGDSGFYFSGFAFIGGFGAGSSFMWDLDANVGFQWLRAFSTLIGYRYMDVKYEDGSFLYDVAQDGLVLAATLRF